MGISHLQNKYTRFNTKTSEEFNTASRSIKPGLIASGIVSAWTCKIGVILLLETMLTFAQGPQPCEDHSILAFQKTVVDFHIRLQSATVAYQYGVAGPFW